METSGGAIQPTQNNPKKSGGLLTILLIVFLVLMAGGAGFLGWKLLDFKKLAESETKAKNELRITNDSLVVKLKELQTEYDSLSLKHVELDSLFTIEKDKIASLMYQIRTFKKSADFYKSRVDSLDSNMKSYLAQIQQLEAEKAALVAENTEVKASLNAALSKNADLTVENESLNQKLQKASTVKIAGLNVTTYKKGSKPKVTDKAKKVAKFKIAFTVAENNVATTGLKTLYIRITKDGTVITKTPSETFTYNGEAMQYSLKKDFSYEGLNVEQSIFYEQTEKFKPGRYIISIYLDGLEVGQAQVVLK